MNEIDKSRIEICIKYNNYVKHILKQQEVPNEDQVRTLKIYTDQISGHLDALLKDGSK